MDIEFVWDRPISAVSSDALELEIGASLEEHPAFVPCHLGKTLIYLSPDALEVTIEGRVVCQCGKGLGSFSWSSDGSRARLKPA
jgi:hypothetical protein